MRSSCGKRSRCRRGRHTYGVFRSATTSRLSRCRLYEGGGPFRFDRVPFADNAIEVRLWSPGTGTLTVYARGNAQGHFQQPPLPIVH